MVLPTLCQRISKHFWVCTPEFFLEVVEMVEVSAWSITEKNNRISDAQKELHWCQRGDITVFRNHNKVLKAWTNFKWKSQIHPLFLESQRWGKATGVNKMGLRYLEKKVKKKSKDLGDTRVLSRKNSLLLYQEFFFRQISRDESIFIGSQNALGWKRS